MFGTIFIIKYTYDKLQFAFMGDLNQEKKCEEMIFPEKYRMLPWKFVTKDKNIPQFVFEIWIDK